jgi:hypothetical protein
MQGGLSNRRTAIRFAIGRSESRFSIRQLTAKGMISGNPKLQCSDSQAGFCPPVTNGDAKLSFYLKYVAPFLSFYLIALNASHGNALPTGATSTHSMATSHPFVGGRVLMIMDDR